jgi:hypothetical protein
LFLWHIKNKFFSNSEYRHIDQQREHTRTATKAASSSSSNLLPLIGEKIKRTAASANTSIAAAKAASSSSSNWMFAFGAFCYLLLCMNNTKKTT